MGLKKQRATARVNKKQGQAIALPTSLDVTLENEGASAVVEALKDAIVALGEQQAQATAQLHRMLMQNNATLLEALGKQTAALTKAVSRDIKVESGEVEVNMPPRAGRFEIEYDEQGKPYALIAADYN